MAKRKSRKRKPKSLPKRLRQASAAARAGRCAVARRLLRQRKTRAPKHLVKMVKKVVAKHC